MVGARWCTKRLRSTVVFLGLVVAIIATCSQLFVAVRMEVGGPVSDFPREGTSIASARKHSVQYWSTVMFFDGLNVTTTTTAKESSHHHTSELASTIHCVGDNFLLNLAWIYRSCHYQNLCWNLASNEHFLVADDLQGRILNDINNFRHNITNQQHTYTRISTLMDEIHMDVSSIGLTRGWIRKFPNKYKWKPTVLNADAILRNRDDTIVQLSNNALTIPISVHPSTLQSPLKVLLDVLLPVYNLLSMFGKSSQKSTILIHIMNPAEACSITTDNSTAGPAALASCWDKLAGYFSLLGYHVLPIGASPVPLTSHLPAAKDISATWICSEAAAGIGMLTAHNVAPPQKKTSRNVGRGRFLWEFSESFIAVEANWNPSDQVKPSSFTVALAMPSGDNLKLKSKSIKSVLSLESRTDIAYIEVDAGKTNDINERTIEVAKKVDLWIAFFDDDNTLWPSFFVPKEASVILFYDKHPSKTFAKADPWNHLAYTNIHWMSLDDMHQISGIMEHAIRESQQKYTVSDSPPDNPMHFQGFQLEPLSSPKMSAAHCIGENWDWDAANYRSCHIRNLCLDTTSAKFVLFDGSHQMHQNSTPSKATIEVMIGHSVRLGTGDPWSPGLRQLPAESQQRQPIRMLPSDVVWIPIFSEQPNVLNPGHLLWDYILPLYNLLAIFHCEESTRILLTNMDPACVEGAPNRCHSMVSKFLPLINIKQHQFHSINEMDASLVQSSSMICSRNALAGIGMLTDHGFKKHGQLIEDYRNIVNVGRGATIWNFRNFVLKNMQVGQNELPKPDELVLVVTFSINSSNNNARSRDFARHLSKAKERFESRNVQIRGVEMSKLSMKEQLDVVATTTIFVSVMGGSASFATFLDRGCSLVLFYSDDSDFVKGGKDPQMPNMMDFDFWNNASHLHVHWLPMRSSEAPEEMNLFLNILNLELQKRSGI